jgi:WD repeat-containing protein 92
VLWVVVCCRDLERLDQSVFSVQAHGSIINAIDAVGGQEVGYGAPELVTGSRDGTLVGGLAGGGPLHVTTFSQCVRPPCVIHSYHSSSHYDSPACLPAWLCVGCVRVWDPRVAEPVLSLEPNDGQPIRDCWAVAFGQSR